MNDDVDAVVGNGLWRGSASTKRSQRAAAMFRSLDLSPSASHDVGVTAESDAPEAASSTVALPSTEETKLAVAVAVFVPRVLLLQRVSRAFVARRAMAASLLRHREGLREVASLKHYVQHSVSPAKRTKAEAVLRRFLRRWRAWNGGVLRRREHLAWLATRGRSGPSDGLQCRDAQLSAEWMRPRSLVSWSYFSAPASPYLPCSPLQRWLRQVRRARGRVARQLQLFWTATKLRVVARKAIQAERAAQQAVIREEALRRVVLQSAELRVRLDFFRRDVEEREQQFRVAIATRFAHAREQMEFKLEFLDLESHERLRLCQPMFNELVALVGTARETILRWRESTVRDKLQHRSVMKLLAVAKERWAQMHDTLVCQWFDVSRAAVRAKYESTMTLTEQDLVDVAYTDVVWSAGGRSGGKKYTTTRAPLANVESVVALTALADQWISWFRSEEDRQWGNINESFGRRVLRLQIDELPLVSALVDRERQHRACLVQQLLRGVVHRRFPAPPPTAKLVSGSYQVATIHRTATVPPRGHVSDATGLQEFFGEDEPQEPRHRRKFGRDGYRFGMSPKLERAVSGSPRTSVGPKKTSNAAA